MKQIGTITLPVFEVEDGKSIEIDSEIYGFYLESGNDKHPIFKFPDCYKKDEKGATVIDVNPLLAIMDKKYSTTSDLARELGFSDTLIAKIDSLIKDATILDLVALKNAGLI